MINRHPRRFGPSWRTRPNRPPEVPNGPVKLIFGLYQCLHHVFFLTGGGVSGTRNRPKPFDRKVEELNRFFRPAQPHSDSGFLRKCKAINEEWQEKQTTNLIEHYKHIENSINGQLSAMKLKKGTVNGYLASARNWAKNHFRRKFQADQFNKLEMIVRSFATDVNPPPPPPPRTTNQNSNSGSTTYAKVTQQRENQNSDGPKTTNSAPANKIQDSGSNKDKSAPVDKTPCSKKSVVPPTVTSTQKSSKKRSRHASLGSPPSPSSVQTPKKTKDSNSNELNSTPLAAPKDTPRTGKKRNRTLSFGSLPSNTNVPTPKKTKESKPDSPKSQGEGSKKYDRVTKFDPLPPRVGPQKINDYWKIPKITKEILVIGAEYFAHITKLDRMDAQILSYPGLTLDKLKHLLENFEFAPGSQDGVRKSYKPNHVIISVGIDDRHCSSSTNSIALKKIIQLAKKKFEGSKISFYQNRFSDKLPKIERDRLLELNNYMKVECEKQMIKVIQPVATALFEIDPSDLKHVKWTEKCANSTITHIIDTALRFPLNKDSDKQSKSPQGKPLN